MPFRAFPLVLCLILTSPPLLRGEEPSGKGQRLFICGHSFNWFIDEPLQALAREAGYPDHQTVGITKLGDSRPIQHWNVPEAQNAAKVALRTGNVDILTLAPHREMPDPGIDLFADYAFEHNPDIRVMAQISWPDFPLGPETDWKKFPALSTAYIQLANRQAEAINKRHGKPIVTLVPVINALLQLRGKIEAGNMPGIKSFSELFVDPKGHPSKPLADLTTFCWFAAIYHKSPVGLNSLDSPKDSVSVARNRILQQIAWDVTGREIW